MQTIYMNTLLQKLICVPLTTERMGAAFRLLPRNLMSDRSLRILLAEDEPWISMFLQELLEDMGHTVLGIATSERMLVEAALRDTPDLLIVDEHLNTGSGANAVRTILQTIFIPHIFTSGDRLPDRQGGPAAILLRKPFRDIELSDAIGRAMLEAG